MYINLTKDELDMVLEALSTVIENASSEMRYSTDTDLDESLQDTIDANNDLFDKVRHQMETPVEKLSVVVCVESGLVQDVWANGDIFVEVYDLDNNTLGEDCDDIAEADVLKDVLRQLVESPEWHTVFEWQ